eukprot:TRINITY_DN15412_c0_g2_i1.p1 TRINITY_DN15412_c0_g2~~TRINITY_DN15412_c0_g2_i1.p1  ORF type:complete len:320 (-),score=65.92 TRINITY_DN15412_c0_g2_i1:190-1077(-)
MGAETQPDDSSGAPASAATSAAGLSSEGSPPARDAVAQKRRRTYALSPSLLPAAAAAVDAVGRRGASSSSASAASSSAVLTGADAPGDGAGAPRTPEAVVRPLRLSLAAPRTPEPLRLRPAPHIVAGGSRFNVEFESCESFRLWLQNAGSCSWPTMDRNSWDPSPGHGTVKHLNIMEPALYKNVPVGSLRWVHWSHGGVRAISMTDSNPTPNPLMDRAAHREAEAQAKLRAVHLELRLRLVLVQRSLVGTYRLPAEVWSATLRLLLPPALFPPRLPPLAVLPPPPPAQLPQRPPR